MTTKAFRFPHIGANGKMETAMSNVLSHWILIGCDAYDEYVFVPWLDRSVYLRTVALRRVCLV